MQFTNRADDRNFFLLPGTKVWIKLADKSKIKGRFISWDGEFIQIEKGEHEHRIALAEIAIISAKERGQAVIGEVIMKTCGSFFALGPIAFVLSIPGTPIGPIVVGASLGIALWLTGTYTSRIKLRMDKWEVSSFSAPGF